jgi:hypothetical protein
MNGADFEHDVFISYAHIDNLRLGSDHEGWVSEFDDALRKRLSQLLGKTSAVWRDPKLQGNDYFDDKIVHELVKAAVLVTVLSPRYAESDWCQKEVNQFLQAAEKNLGVRIKDQSRIFKVIKTPVSLKKHPPKIRDLLGYEFFHKDPQTQRFREFSRIYGREYEVKFWNKLEDLVFDIRQMLKVIRGKETATTPSVTPSGFTVYLAETTSDLSSERDQILSELKTRGHTVLPDRTLPLTGPELESVVKENLGRCTLSVHLIGKNYGIVPESIYYSVVEIQNSLAAEYSKQTPDFSRLIWLPPGLEPRDVRQETFVRALQNDPALQPGDDLLQIDLEELKTVIQDKLKVPEPKPAPDMSGTSIYLIYDQGDRKAIKPLSDYLCGLGLRVIKPLFDGEEIDIREEHEDSLSRCDSVLIYWGNAKEAWLRKKLRDLRRAPGFGRSTPFQPQQFIWPALRMMTNKTTTMAKWTLSSRASRSFRRTSLPSLWKSSKAGREGRANGRISRPFQSIPRPASL